MYIMICLSVSKIYLLLLFVVLRKKQAPTVLKSKLHDMHLVCKTHHSDDQRSFDLPVFKIEKYQYPALFFTNNL